WMGNVYVGAALSPAIALEGLLGLYFFGGVMIGLLLGEWLFSIFMLLPAYGFSRVFLASIGEGRHG
ncbi:MAG: histidine kinase, partial [Candidatus Sumerlaeia bacterium]|nr:histidine kinase [Candidatus Sumerlaeia bacterium]